MGLLREFAAWRAFGKLPPDRRRLVFYSESQADWPHLEPLIHALVEEDGQPVAYVCSDPRDPGLGWDHKLFSAFQLGTGAFRTIFFQTLSCDVAVMTMPDLDVYHLKKRSAVHYVYVFHAINSAHMIYPANSFDAYDTLFCVGPHHCAELRALEQARGLGPRRLVAHGYGKLDRMLERGPAPPRAEGAPHVLVAPSWGASSLVDICGVELVSSLLRDGISVTFRPHPMTVRAASPGYAALARMAGETNGLRLDTSASGMDVLSAADLLVTDWSGIAFEFFFGLGRPVLFVDVPPKVRNPAYEEIGPVPLERQLRARMGGVLPLAEVGLAGARARALLADSDAFPGRAGALRDEWIFNPGASGRAGAGAIRQLLAARKSGATA
jgi:hypothetical protein